MAAASATTSEVTFTLNDEERVELLSFLEQGLKDTLLVAMYLNDRSAGQHQFLPIS